MVYIFAKRGKIRKLKLIKTGCALPIAEETIWMASFSKNFHLDKSEFINFIILEYKNCYSNYTSEGVVFQVR